jgi:hypothetical protein
MPEYFRAFSLLQVRDAEAPEMPQNFPRQRRRSWRRLARLQRKERWLPIGSNRSSITIQGKAPGEHLLWEEVVGRTGGQNPAFLSRHEPSHGCHPNELVA